MTASLVNLLPRRVLPAGKSLTRLCLPCFRRFISYKHATPCFVTTPIFYVNAGPHIGHLYTVLLADAHGRWNRLTGRTVIFSTGTDEHGLKIQQAAARSQRSLPDYCDDVSQQFKVLFESANIQYDDFIRTTEDRHKRAVQRFWECLESNGHIYRGSYEGWYSVSDEAFLTSEEVKDVTTQDGSNAKVSVESEQPVTWLKEDNYMFRLSAFTHRLQQWLDTGAVKPSKFDSVIRQYLQDLPDLSVSRQRERLPWGVPVPGDESQTIYVWLDALINYLTVAGYPDNLTTWPPTSQIIGKDILKFHAVYWPAFLMAADLPPPPRLLCHSHWLVDGRKMSKSLGNVVDPTDCMDRYTMDGLRYFLLKEGTPHSDGNYTDRKVMETINSGLVNTIGNLLHRCTSSSINRAQVFPPLNSHALDTHFCAEEIHMYNTLKTLPDSVDEHYQNLTIYKALDELMSVLHQTNAMFDHHKPWQLTKQMDQSEHLNTVLHVAMETLRTCGILMQPVIPNMAHRLLTKLGIGADSRTVNSIYEDFVKDEPVSLGTDTSVLLKRVK
ncbi:methionine--tRNA ligase, mitochondrial-like [Haliotis asinina]|uniref:methionine--tRNA ligase, mitochondrial-like n=1 Tax=Haliotis asinina TaxID=109174 RepID=UPI0035319E43